MTWMLLAAAFATPDCNALDEALTRDEPGHCGTPLLHAARAHCPDVLAAHGLPVVTPMRGGPPAPPGGKITRDVEETWPNLIETTNFAVKWGSDGTVRTEDVQKIADAFELAWAEEVVAWGYPAPEQSSAYRFNVYIGDTGGLAPSAQGNGGYFWYDNEGYPLIVINRGTLQDEIWAGDVATHEFFHAIQGAIDTYQYDGAGAWYYEATASWAETEVFGTTTSNAGFLFGFALLPELNVGFFDYPDEGSLQEYHQYGAFIFISHLSEIAGDDEMIRRSFLEAPRGGDPLLELDDLLAEHGTTLEETHTDFAGRMATWDFPDGDIYEAAYRPYSDMQGGHRIEDTLTVVAEPATVTPAHPPQAYGVNLWRLQTAGSDVQVTFTPTSAPTAWHLTLSGMRDGEGVQIALPTDGTTVTTEDMANLSDVHLVVSAIGGTADYTTSYAYTLTVAPADFEPPDTGFDLELPVACGCSTGGGALGWFVLPLLALRRRQGRDGAEKL
ncbi:MAG: hypothetical protein KC912_07750 [Proteobacteria bacterium]|nr:hypothetical protein [Pseudomonadota bacterium]